MEEKKENPYLKRALLYLPISIMSILYGVLHAIKISAVSVTFIQWIKYIGLAIPLLFDNFLFLTFYTQVFRGNETLPDPPIKVGTQNSIGYICCIQMMALIIISNCYSLAYALVVACFSVITVISCILMNKKATKWMKDANPLKQQKVRLELIWPSLYVVALCIVSGYFLVVSGATSMDIAASIPIVLPMGVATAYAIAMFWVDDYKSKKKNKEALHPVHIVFLILLIVLALLQQVSILLENGEKLFLFQYMGLLLWSVAISAVFAQFEAWAVVERRRNDTVEIKRYIRSANIVMVALLFFLPILYLFSFTSDISPFYMVGFCLISCTYLSIRIFCFHHETKGEHEYIPNEKSVREIKILLTALCTTLLVVSELLPNDVIMQFEHFLSNDVPTILSILSGIPLVAIILQSWLKKEMPFNDIGGTLFNLSSYETTGNLCRQVLYCSLVGLIGCFIAIFTFIKYIEGKTMMFPYKLSITCMYYMVVTLVCWSMNGIKYIKEINNQSKTTVGGDPRAEEETSQKEVDQEENARAMKKIKKILELLHVPSSAMIFLLIFIPSIINTSNFFVSLVRSLPLTCIAMAGFALNNYVDAEKDFINKPNRAIPSGVISKRFAMRLCVCLYSVSTIILFLFSQSLFEMLICVTASVGTIIYSLCAKQIGYVKTLITGLLTITPFLMVFYYYNPKINELLFIFAVVLSTIGKELLMDVRDISGDEAVGQFTVATLLGERITQILSMCISGLAIVFYLLSYQFVIPLSLGLISVAIGILIVSYKIWFSSSEREHEFGIYLLWGVIAICSLPILV